MCKSCGVVVDRPKRYCSESCEKLHHTKPRKVNRPSQLVGREAEFLSLYEETNSINRALKKMGFVGAGDYYYWAKQLLN